MHIRSIDINCKSSSDLKGISCVVILLKRLITVCTVCMSFHKIQNPPLLLELFSQIGRILSVHKPKDKLIGTNNGYGFVEFTDVTDAEYEYASQHGQILWAVP